MTDKSQPWYVHQRGELLAAAFLNELAPVALIGASDNMPLDFVALFHGDDHGLRLLGVEVKTTEKQVTDKYLLVTSRTQVDSLTKASFPVLLLIVDVKRSAVHYAWASKIKLQLGARKGDVRCNLAVRNATSDKGAILSHVREWRYRTPRGLRPREGKG